ncbi:MAG: 50S ribosomal protein L3 [Nitrososphaerales archaeon]
MGHRKHNAPRRGSLAFRPRARTSHIVPLIRTWPEIPSDKPTLLGHAGFKAGCIHVITIDDREGTPNFGKPLFNAATVLVTPPLYIYGLRAYHKVSGYYQPLTEAHAKNLPKDLARKVRIQPKPIEEFMKVMEERLSEVKYFTALCYLRPKDIGLSQKKPFLFEIRVGGGDLKAQLDYLISILGKEVKISDIFKPGMYIDVIGITKGKGFEGPVTRMGVKRKQHKSRKSVRAIGTLGPWHPASVMYTVPRAGQMGFHQRTEYNKRILIMSNENEMQITPKGGFPHFGVVKGDYIVVSGSVPGPAKRLIRLRFPIRAHVKKIQPPKVIEISVTQKVG